MSKKKSVNRPVPVKPVIASVPKRPAEPAHDISRSYWFMILLCILPFVFSRTILDPVIVPRFLVLTFFLAAYLLYFYLVKKANITLTGLPKMVFIVGLIFFAWNLVSLTGAINPNAALFELLRILINLVLVFLIMDMVTKDESSLLRISKVLLFVAIIHAFVVIVQYYGWGFKDLPGANALPYGLMANRNLMGSAQVFLVPFVVYVLYAGSKGWKMFASFSLFMLIVSIVLSQTRSAWLALLAFLLLSLILVLIFVKAQRKTWVIGTVVTIGIAIFIGVFLTSFDKGGTLSDELKNRAGSFANAASDSSISQRSLNDRLDVWKKTLTVVADKPVTGVGLSNWNLSILGYGVKGLAWADGYFVPDRVHNVYLQMASELGIPGLLIFLCFWLLIGWVSIKGIQKAERQGDKILLILLTAGLAAFAVDAMFSFPLERIEHSFYISLMAGGILGIYARTRATNDTTVSYFPKWVFGLSLLIVIIGIFIGFKRQTFEKNLHIVKAAEKEGTAQDVLEYANRGKQPWIRLDQEGLSLETKEAIAHRNLKDFPKAIETMKTALKLNPNSHMALSNMGTIYTEMGDYKTAITYYEKALKSAPDFDIIKKNLALNYYNVGRYQDCINTLQSFNYQEEPLFIDVMNQSKNFLASDTTRAK